MTNEELEGELFCLQVMTSYAISVAYKDDPEGLQLFILAFDRSVERFRSILDLHSHGFMTGFERCRGKILKNLETAVVKRTLGEDSHA